MTKATLDEFSQAVALLSPDDIMSNGAPKVDAVNAALNEAGFEDITAAERDDLWKQLQDASSDTDDGNDTVSPDAAPLEDADTDDLVTIKLTAAPSNPMVLYVHGVGRFEMRVGEEASIPVEALPTLENVGGAEFSKV